MCYNICVKRYTPESIAIKYLAGESGLAIAKQYGITKTAIYYNLRKLGIDRRVCYRWPIVNLPISVISEYKSGKSSNKIAKELNVSPSSVIRFLHRNNVHGRNPSEARRKCSFDESVFDEIDENSAYWAGFIAADGTISIRKDGSPSIMVTLSSVDADHIQKLKSFFKTSRKISIQHRQNREYYGISVTSKNAANRLMDMGITPRKTFTLKVSGELSNSRHFWRGFMDGDGHIAITKRGRPIFQITCASRILLDQFLFFLRKNGIGDHLFIYPQRKYFRIATTGEDAKNICDLLYSDCSISLDRKQAIANIISDLDAPRHYNHQLPIKNDTIR